MKVLLPLQEVWQHFFEVSAKLLNSLRECEKATLRERELAEIIEIWVPTLRRTSLA
jgi:hypothetical protein